MKARREFYKQELIRNNMEKKGQVTIFIIIAIVIIGIAVTFFAFKDTLNIGKASSSDVDPINTEFLSCLESTTEEGITFISLQGGYYEIPEDIAFSYIVEKAPYYYMNSKKYIPSTERIERELENYITEKLGLCLNFSSFEVQGFEINEGDLSTSITVEEEKVYVDVNYPLVIKKGEETYRMNEFKINTISSLSRLYSASREIVNSYYDNPGFVCLGCLEETSENYGVITKATLVSDASSGENVIWFSVLDEEGELNWKFVVEQ